MRTYRLPPLGFVRLVMRFLTSGTGLALMQMIVGKPTANKKDSTTNKL